MTALTITALIAITIIGLVVLAELVAVTLLLFRVNRLTQQVRDRIDPVVDQSNKVMHKVNDVADTVKTDTRRVADSVAGMTERLTTMVDMVSHRVDRTSDTVQSVTTSAVRQLTTPPILTALALFTSLQIGATFRRLLGWPLLAMITLFAGIPAGLRAWRSYQQSQTATGPHAHLVIHRPVEEETIETVRPRAA